MPAPLFAPMANPVAIPSLFQAPPTGGPGTVQYDTVYCVMM